jgi:methionine sulfoxide reductase heme-binding subunit
MMLGTSSVSLWYATRATGIVALVLLTMTVVFGVVTAGRAKSRAWPAFAQADLHKRVSVIALVVLGIHVLTSVLDTYVHLGWMSIVVPFASSYQPLWTGLGTVALDLILAVAVSSALRQHLEARTWRILHWLGPLCWPIAMAHALGEGTDAGTPWMEGLAAACVAAVVVATYWRIGRLRPSAPGGAVPPSREVGGMTGPLSSSSAVSTSSPTGAPSPVPEQVKS